MTQRIEEAREDADVDEEGVCEHCGEYEEFLEACDRCRLDMCPDCINLHACIDGENDQP